MKIFGLFLLTFFLLTSFVEAGTSVDHDDANCQGAWLMDANTNPEPDDSQNTNTAAHVGNPTHATVSPPAAYSTGYYDLDGDSDSFNCGTDSSLNLTGALSLTLWHSVDSIPDGTAGILMDQDSSTRAWDWAIIASLKQELFFRYSGSWDTLVSDTALATDGTWYYLTLVFTPSTSYVYYLDGVADGTLTSGVNAGIDDAGTQFGIGDRITGTHREADGRFDEPAVFDRALDSTEVNDLMDNGLAPSAVSAIKTINGLAKASVKTVDGLAIANVKSWNGLE